MINNLPKSWEDITLDQYIELDQLDSDSFENEFDLILEQLSIILNTSSDDDIFDELDIDELVNIMSKIKWLRKEPPTNVKNKINNLTLKDLNKLKLGEFIDLEYFFSIDYKTNLHIIASILYKQNKEDEWCNTIEEPYIYDVYKRGEIFKSLPITNTYGLITNYLNWKETFLDIYENLFEDSNYDKIENEEMFDQDELKELKDEIEVDKKKAAFSWEAILWELSGNNIANYDEVLNTSLVLVMNTLSMRKTLKV